ncbi:hypothetical protein TNCT_738341 [Trichonephila clavata]|uniref:Uncharacterized protein n=1 Tax=Trichonephila clavata TaxID=2740835 RepID=A0A8X6LHB6_TRICU|nr:hypothetical protein TNCT_738341 [Trichonephila clavata]
MHPRRKKMNYQYHFQRSMPSSYQDYSDPWEHKEILWCQIGTTLLRQRCHTRFGQQLGENENDVRLDTLL